MLTHLVGNWDTDGLREFGKREPVTTIEIDPDLAKRTQRGDIFEVPADMAAEIEADIAKFEKMLALHLAGEIEDDTFRVFRLNNGIYGQRQGGTVPAGSPQPQPGRAIQSFRSIAKLPPKLSP